MTIRLTEADVEEQFQEANEEELQFDPTDGLDITLKYDARFSQGWRREIDLREGICLSIDQTRSVDRILVDSTAYEAHYIYLRFLLLGRYQRTSISKLSEISLSRTSGQYLLLGSGTSPKQTEDYRDDPDTRFYSSITIVVEPEILYSFTASGNGELPKHLRHLIRPPEREGYARSGNTQLAMAAVLQQILHCSYQGITKRAYLEGKVVELAALVLDHEIAIQQGEVKKTTLKPEQIERVHYAREILLRDSDNPPSLEALAQQVGLNDFMLRQGFRQAFGTTVFGQLQAHRLEIAKQLLAEQDISVMEVAQRVGYASVPSFVKAFKRKFEITPKTYQKACR